MRLSFVISLFFLIISLQLKSQTCHGRVINKKNGSPVPFVNIGIVDKNMGTVSDEKGFFDLMLESRYNNDTLLFSCLGFESKAIKISDLKQLQNKEIRLTEKHFELKEVVIKPKNLYLKTLGIETESKAVLAGFSENKLGYECGIMMKNKGIAYLEKLIINIASCSYDSIYYRVNIYSKTGKMSFKNILKTPIYIKMSQEDVKNKIVLDLSPYNLIISGNFLITLEHIKNLGDGNLLFSSRFPGKTIYRKTSQGMWEKSPVGIGLALQVKIKE